MSIRRALFNVCGSLVTASLLLVVSSSSALATPGPVHVANAERLLEDLTVSRQNVYASSPSFILWDGPRSQARTVCGTFVTNLLLHSYNWTTSTLTKWLGTTSPYAETYYSAIVAQNNFARINNIQQVQPGDIIAIKYLDTGTTGHAMMVDSSPRAHSAQSPIVAGTTQYAVTVIDSSSGYHGAADTRRTNTSSTGNGVGRGTIRVYVDSALKPVGYTWADEPGSQYYGMSQRPLAIGRLDLTNLGGAAQAIASGSSRSSGGSGGGDGSASPPMASSGGGELVFLQEDLTSGKTDDETLAAQNLNDGSSPEAAEMGGCSLTAHRHAGTASPAALTALALIMGLYGLRRRHSRMVRRASRSTT